MKKSIELEILIESVKVCLLGNLSTNFDILLRNPNINWNRLEKLATFHAIRPILSDAFQQVNFENPLAIQLKNRTLTQSIFNLATNQELERLLRLLNEKGVQVLPYKGVLFISELYQNKQLRETHDLDLLVHPKDAKKALEILLEDGYTFDITNIRKLNQNQIIDSLINTFDFIEVGLDKKTKLGFDIHIDFHWHIKEESHEFKVNFDDFFINNLENSGQFSTSQKTLFIMLLVHHGGRECWTRLKHFCDLIQFLKTTSLTMEELNEISTKIGMKRFFEVGMEVYQNELINISSSDSNKKTLKQEIIQYWEIGKLWLRLDLRIRFALIYIKLLDKKISFLKYLLKNYRYLSKPNLIENPRLITFPNNYPFLNFISKVVTFVWTKTILSSYYSLKKSL